MLSFLFVQIPMIKFVHLLNVINHHLVIVHLTIRISVVGQSKLIHFPLCPRDPTFSRSSSDVAAQRLIDFSHARIFTCVSPVSTGAHEKNNNKNRKQFSSFLTTRIATNRSQFSHVNRRLSQPSAIPHEPNAVKSATNT